jgi:hypothetical protein
MEYNKAQTYDYICFAEIVHEVDISSKEKVEVK